MKKVDIVMWTKNAGNSFSHVLKTIEKVIPKEYIGQKIIVDDNSTDNTKKWAEAHNWKVVPNKGTGISDGANTALELVKTEYFISIEQDVVLAEDWWDKMCSLLLNSVTVVVASGVRIPNQPEGLRVLQETVTDRYSKEKNFLYGKTLDNTMYSTNFLKNVIGGFPKLNISAGIDTVLAKKVQEVGLAWAVDYTVRSIHLRKGLLDELRHYYWYGKCHKELMKHLGNYRVSFLRVLASTGFSPIRGMQLAIKQRCWQISYVYPLIRLCSLVGVIRGYF